MSMDIKICHLYLSAHSNQLLEKIYIPLIYYLWCGAGDLLSKFLFLEGLRSLRDSLKMLAAVLDLTG